MMLIQLNNLQYLIKFLYKSILSLTGRVEPYFWIGNRKKEILEKDNYNDVKLFSQKDETIETQLRLRILLCDPQNNEGIICENDTNKIQSFID